MWALAMLACVGDQARGPKKLVGDWEVLQVEVPDGVLDGADAVTADHPGCVWGRQVFSFEEAAVSEGSPAPTEGSAGWLTARTDILCPTQASGELFGCTVTARSPATWTPATRSWSVPQGAAVENRTRPLDDSAISSGTTCRAEVWTGEYAVVPVRGQKWKWEMRTPEGKVLRLRPPVSEDPDFIAALDQVQRKGAAPGGAAAEGGK